MRALSNLLNRLIYLAAFLLALPVLAAASESANLANYLNPDGSMNLPADFVGSLDPAGFRMVQQPGEAPRFVAEKSVRTKSSLFGTASGCNGPVRAIARAPAGVLYMGGEFSVCADVLAANIVAYNPQTKAFRALGSAQANGVNGAVYALEASGNELYVGGNFRQAGGSAASRVARWNGSAWSSLGSGSANGVNNTVSSFAVSGSNVYVGGYFTRAGSVVATRVAR